MNEPSYEICEKKRFRYWYDAMCQATYDEETYGDKRKVYFCWLCNKWHTSRERMKVDIGILER